LYFGPAAASFQALPTQAAQAFGGNSMTNSHLSIAVALVLALICGLVIVWRVRRKSRTPQSPDDFLSTLLKQNQKALGRAVVESKFGPNEAKLLRKCFYDARLKVRRSEVPIFYIYAVLCESEPIDFWPLEITKIDIALLNLRSIDYITKGKIPDLLPIHVGKLAETHKLTAEGLERLQSWHPDLALRIKAWIRVMPPWAVLTGSVCGAVGAIWKASEVASELPSKLHWILSFIT
jgi:hypothetical protein